MRSASTVPTLPGLTEEEASSVYGAHRCPHCMLDVSGNYATLTTLLPRSATSTTIVNDYLLAPDVIADAWTAWNGSTSPTRMRTPSCLSTTPNATPY